MRRGRKDNGRKYWKLSKGIKKILEMYFSIYSEQQEEQQQQQQHT